MKTFQRYIIIGTYFFVISFLWLRGVSQVKLTIEMLGFSIIALLPIGYLVSVLANYLYYHGVFGKPLFEQIYAEMNEDAKAQLLATFENDGYDEVNIETKLTIVRTIEKERSFANNFGATSLHRREVIGINNSLILATLASFIWPVLQGMKIHEPITLNIIVWAFVMSVFSVVLAWALSASNALLEKQMIELHADLHTYLNPNIALERGKEH